MKYAFAFILLLLAVVIWKNIIPEDKLVGKYVNNNTHPILEGPRSIELGYDTLTLYKGGRFDSQTWGEGTYEILEGKKINFTYPYEMGKAGYNTSYSKSLTGKVRILLNHDLGFYFMKI